MYLLAGAFLLLHISLHWGGGGVSADDDADRCGLLGVCTDDVDGPTACKRRQAFLSTKQEQYFCLGGCADDVHRSAAYEGRPDAFKTNL